MGEVPKAFVARRAGTDVSKDELMGFVVAKVATFKQLREVKFIGTLPKTCLARYCDECW